MAERIWGLHARDVDPPDHFLKTNRIAIGWPAVGDLSGLKRDREAFKSAVIRAYPDTKPGAVPVWGGTLFKFAYEIKEGDLIVYPTRYNRVVNIGRVTGDYKYDPSFLTYYPQTRSVEWLRHLPRASFSQGALHEIGSAVTLFQVQTYVDEFVAALTDSAAVASADDEEEAIERSTEETEETLTDFILRRLAQRTKGYPFQEFIGHLLRAMGYYARVSPVGSDGGIDIIAHRDELGFEPPIIKVQVKSTEGTVGNPEVAELNGNLGEGEYGLIITLGTFSKQAQAFVRSKSNIRLIDAEALVELILAHYEKLDGRNKAIIPLRRAYIPVAVEGGEDDEKGR